MPLIERYRYAQLLAARDEGEGFCLECGVRQPVLETRAMLGPCEHCYNSWVAPADWVLRSMELLSREPEDLGDNAFLDIGT